MTSVTIRRSMTAAVLFAALTLAAAPLMAGPATLPAGSKGNIIVVAKTNGNFNTLIKALEAAHLGDMLAGGEEGEFTVFAPTDEAFAALPEGALDGLLADQEKLKAVLQYHIVKGKVDAATVKGLSEAKTMSNDAVVKVTINADKVMINDATVTAPDVMADNGIIHVIDKVLMPPAPAAEGKGDALSTEAKKAGSCCMMGKGTEAAACTEEKPAGKGDDAVCTETKSAEACTMGAKSTEACTESEKIEGKGDGTSVEAKKGGSCCMMGKDGATAAACAESTTVGKGDEPAKADAKTIAETAAGTGKHSTFVKAVEAAGLAETLKGKGPFTVFAPTDEAFAALPAGELDKLMADKEMLKMVLLYHVVAGSNDSKAVGAMTTATSMAGPAIKVESKDGSVFVGGAKVTMADVACSNGTIHVIDKVLTLPTE